MSSLHTDFLTTSTSSKDNNPLILININEQGNIQQAEGSGLDLSGLAQENFLGLRFDDKICPLYSIADKIALALTGESLSAQWHVSGQTYDVWLTPIERSGESYYVVATCLLHKNHHLIESVQELRTHYSIFTEHMTDIITKYDAQGICCYASPTVEKVLGYKPAEIIGQPATSLLHADDQRSRKKIYSKLISDPADDTVCYRVKRKDGVYIWLETKSKPIYDESGQNIIEIIAVSRDITERKETEERLLYLANYDSLTGLPNRALFRDRLRRAIARAQRNNSKLALMFLDLDRFKNINDSLGHHAGDQLLRGVARRLKQNAREGDTIARLGGDEFTVILEGINGNDDAATVAKKILEIMEPPFKADGHEITATPSIGITVYPDDAGDMRTLLKNADTAMYRSKEKGRNRYQFYTADMNAKAYQYLLLENNLRHALEREEFLLYYQPQLDLHTQGIIGLEALLRWNHPEQGLLSPEVFVPFAEETGLIVPIGEWVLRTACKHAKSWQDAGLPPYRVAVNLSMRQFRQKGFVDMVANALIESGLDAHYLELEITESFLAHNVEQATKLLHRLHSLGVHLSIDDFGTGYSSLSYLKRFPLNTLKIDQSFVRDITSDDDSATIAEAIIALGKSLGLNVIAEGVETEDQVFFLRNIGCDRAQGYLLSHPLPEQQLGPWMQNNDARRVLFEQHSFWPEVVSN